MRKAIEGRAGRGGESKVAHVSHESRREGSHTTWASIIEGDRSSVVVLAVSEVTKRLSGETNGMTMTNMNARQRRNEAMLLVANE